MKKIKSFQDFYARLSPDEKRELAENADTSVAYLNQIKTGHRNAGRDLIERLMAADGRISFRMFATQV